MMQSPLPKAACASRWAWLRPGDQAGIVVGDAHAATATTSDGLDHHRVTDRAGDTRRPLRRSRPDRSVARHRGDVGLLASALALRLVTERHHRFGGRTDELDVAVAHDLGEVAFSARKP